MTIPSSHVHGQQVWDTFTVSDVEPLAFQLHHFFALTCVVRALAQKGYTHLQRPSSHLPIDIMFHLILTSQGHLPLPSLAGSHPVPAAPSLHEPPVTYFHNSFLSPSPRSYTKPSCHSFLYSHDLIWCALSTQINHGQSQHGFSSHQAQKDH